MSAETKEDSARRGARFLLAIVAATIAWPLVLGSGFMVLRAIRISGLVIFTFSIPPHLYPGTVWDDYPIWYHLFFLALVVPMHLVGGKLKTSKGAPNVQPQPA